MVLYHRLNSNHYSHHHDDEPDATATVVILHTVAVFHSAIALRNSDGGVGAVGVGWGGQVCLTAAGSEICWVVVVMWKR